MAILPEKMRMEIPQFPEDISNLSADETVKALLHVISAEDVCEFLPTLINSLLGEEYHGVKTTVL